MRRYGIGYVIIALGSPDERCTLDDLEVVQEVVEARTLFKATVLDGDTADAVTATLLQRGEGVKL